MSSKTTTNMLLHTAASVLIPLSAMATQASESSHEHQHAHHQHGHHHDHDHVNHHTSHHHHNHHHDDDFHNNHHHMSTQFIMQPGSAAVGSAVGSTVTASVVPVAEYNSKVMPKSPTAIQCILNLSIQYFVIYTFLALSRSAVSWLAVNAPQSNALSKVQGFARLMESATSTVNYAPMLAVLFLGVRLRAEQLTQGRTEEFVLPTGRTKDAMQISTFCVLGQLIMVLIIPILTGDMSGSVATDSEGNVDLSVLSDSTKSNTMKWVAYILNFVRYGLLVGLYTGTVLVIVGIHSMEAPKSIFPDGTPPVSPAIGATINLTTQFFIIYFLLALVRTYVSFKGTGPAINKLGGALQLAAYTVNLAPMLCILFIAARMRALQINPLTGSPQPWAQEWFWYCCYSIMVQSVLVLVTPYTSSTVKCVRGDFEGDVKFVGLSGWFAYIMISLRYIALFALYGGFSIICYSVFTIETPTGVRPPLSSALLCTLILTFQYFAIYLVLFLAQSIKSTISISSKSDPSNPNSNGSSESTVTSSKMSQKTISILTKISLIAENSRATVMFAPMLSTIYIGARFRAIQLSKTVDGYTPSGAAPQTYVQDCMYLTTYSVLIQILTVIVLSALYGPSIELDENNNPSNPNQPKSGVVAILLSVIKYLSLIFMYGGISGIVVGILRMTPEKIKPYSNESLVPGIEVPVPGGAKVEGFLF